MANPLNPFMSGVQNLYTDVTGALMGADLQGARANPMFYLGGQILGRGKSRSPQPLFNMRDLVMAEALADRQKKRQFFSDLAQEATEHEDAKTQYGADLDEYKKQVYGATAPVVESYQDMAMDLARQELPAYESQQAEVLDRQLEVGNITPEQHTHLLTDLVQDYAPPTNDLAMIRDLSLAREGMEPPVAPVNPLSRENLTRKLLTSGEGSLQQLGLAETFKPPTYMNVGWGDTVINTRTGEPLDLSALEGVQGGQKPTQLWTSGEKQALAGGFSYGTPEFNKEARRIDSGLLTQEALEQKKEIAEVKAIRMFESPFVAGGAKRFFEVQAEASSAVSLVNSHQIMEDLLEDGIFTGKAANLQLGRKAYLQYLGFTEAQLNDPVANTEAFMAAVVGPTAEVIKAFGAGTGLSDADREFALRGVGGTIKLTEAGIRRIIKINKKIAAFKVRRFKSMNKMLPENVKDKMLRFEEAFVIENPTAAEIKAMPIGMPYIKNDMLEIKRIDTTAFP